MGEKRWRNFRTARAFVRKLGLKNDAEWRLYCKGELPGLNPKPLDIPVTPERVYKDDGYIDLGDWLGTGNINNRKVREAYTSFAKARKFARSLKLKNRDEWIGLHRQGDVPEIYPQKPERVYQDQGWVSMGDFLGTGFVHPTMRKHRNFRMARAFARRLKLNSRREWEEYCRGQMKGKLKRPEDIPAYPNSVYKDKGWLGWADWLGKK